MLTNMYVCSCGVFVCVGMRRCSFVESNRCGKDWCIFIKLNLSSSFTAQSKSVFWELKLSSLKQHTTENQHTHIHTHTHACSPHKKPKLNSIGLCERLDEAFRYEDVGIERDNEMYMTEHKCPKTLCKSRELKSTILVL